MNRFGTRQKRVVIVDDSKTMQAALHQIFSHQLGFDVVGLASDVQSAAPMIRTLRPDLVTIDLCMPYIDGSKLLEMIADLPRMHKVVVAGQACSNLALITMLREAGADACIDKMAMSRDPAAFCRDILAIMAKPACSVASRDTSARPATAGGPAGSCTNTYPIPLDERARLAALRKAGLANDDVDHQLDLLTAHLGATTGFPTCVVTFIDRDTQWIKSAHGFARGSTPRAVAFCNYTLCGDEPLIVPNAAIDPRFANNVLVTGEPRIRTYVGCPVVVDNIRMGAVCLVDSKPRRVTPGVLANLQSISRIAAEFVAAKVRAMPQAA